ncbi:AAA family ATPase [Microbacterium sp. P05]|uniref:AAA family ATPase n=1 Tax=Microbacterium sp. P05 TaxID=3366948 RepID=UPI0037471591
MLFVTSFDAPLNPGELPGPSTGYQDLDGAGEVAAAVAEQLKGIGYAVRLHSEPTAEELGAHVESLVHSGAADDLRIVHVISHASVSPSIDKLHIIGRDSTAHPGAIVERWLEAVEFSQSPPTLFVLDTCFAGKSTTVPWDDKRGNTEPRAVVLAASAWDDRAYEFRLSKAVTSLLSDPDAIDAFPSLPHLKWDLVARTLRDRIAELAEGTGYPQFPTSTPLDPTVVDLDRFAPFFPNPHYLPPSPAEAARDAAPVAVAPFVDGVDVGHFLTRALAHQHTDSSPGLFRGRDDQLSNLSQWLDHDSPNDRIRIVTGDPGSGKSALLGVLVCSMLEPLRQPTARAWQHLPVVPSPLKRAAAVHARGRGLLEIVHTIAEQLGLSSAMERNIEKGARSVVAALVDAVGEAPRPATIVVDAIDESPEASQIVRQLLIPLASDRRNASATCRLLIGTRSGPNWPAAEPIIELARIDQVIDLSAVSTLVLRSDLFAYVRDALTADAQWGQQHSRYAEIAADQVSRKLALSHDTESWGEFLVAGLFVDHLARNVAPDNEHALSAALEGIPQSLPDVLELQLQNEDGESSRLLLTAFSLAKGEGIPLSLAGRIAATLAGDDLWTAEEAARVRDRIIFYLRATPDTDGTSLYRPFHEGIARHLVARLVQTDLSKVLDVVMDSRRLGGALQWADAPPYLQRHLLEHARDAGRAGELLQDPEVLVLVDPAAIQRLVAPRSERAWSPPPAYGLVRLAGTTPHQRRDLLMLAAIEDGDHELSHALQAHASNQSSWDPTWTILGTKVRVVDAESKLEDWITTTALLPSTESARVVTGHESGLLRVWDVMSRELVGGTVDRGSAVVSLALAAVEESYVAAIGRIDGSVGVSDLRTGRQISAFSTGGKAVSTLRTVPHGVHFIVYALTVDGSAFEWRSDTEQVRRIPPGEFPFRAIATGVMDGVPHTVTGDDRGNVRVWKRGTSTPLSVVSGHAAQIRALSCARVGGRLVAVAGDARGGLTAWDVTHGTELARSPSGHDGAISSITCATVDGTAVVVSGGDDASVRTSDLLTLRALDAPLTVIGPVTELSAGPLDGRLAVRSGGKVAVYEWSRE